ncbi:uncharacterized protein [Pempheris klunzingeri]|uniref:uncharacterized protein n=1 Tax=Pempheris klunzingeri TaxID=3127111 RepID=UPI00397EA58E
MSGGVNVKSAPRAPPPSGIPLPHSLLPSSPKTGTCRRAADLSRPSARTPKHTPTHTPTHTPMHSPSLCPRSSSIPGPSSRDPARDGALKSQLLKQMGALPAPQVSRSAYSSPLTQRRAPHPKDTLDLGKPAALHIPSHFSHDGNRNRNSFANKNQTWETSNLRPPVHFRRGDNSNTVSQAASEVVPQREEEPPENHPAQSTILSNGNLRPCLTQTSFGHTIRGCTDSASQSDEEMGTPEDSSPVFSPGLLPLPPITLTMPVMSKVVLNMQDQSLDQETVSTDTHAPRVNMATVAPFSYRIQVQESDLSVDELSDCSSGSIEVSCDDLTPAIVMHCRGQPQSRDVDVSEILYD